MCLERTEFSLRHCAKPYWADVNRRFKGRSHIRCALLRCALLRCAKTFLVFLLAQQRMCKRPSTLSAVNAPGVKLSRPSRDVVQRTTVPGRPLCMAFSTAVDARSSVFTARCYACAVLAMACVRPSVTSRCSIETAERFELIFGT